MKKEEYLKFLDAVLRLFTEGYSRYMCTAAIYVLVLSASPFPRKALREKAPEFMEWINMTGREYNPAFLDGEAWCTTELEEEATMEDCEEVLFLEEVFCTVCKADKVMELQAYILEVRGDK